jgi:hypothetical protein
MKIYRIVADVNTFLSFLPKNINQTNLLIMDCKTKINIWNDIDFYILQTNKEKGNFYGTVNGGGLIIDSKAAESLAYFWESSGELLPFDYNKEKFYFFNPLNCYDLLDQIKTEWEYGKTTNKPIRIIKYYFIKERMTETPIFKIPQTMKSEILVSEGLKDEEDEFIYQVKKNNLKGLKFQELWIA